MKIIITEEQLNKYKRTIKEQNNSLETLNNFITRNKVYVYGSVKVYLKNIELSGDVEDPSINATIDKITYEDKDVTEFAINYAIIDQWVGDDLPLGTLLKQYIVDSLDRMVKKALQNELSEYDVVLHLFA